MKTIRNENILVCDVDETLYISTSDKSLKTRPVWDEVTNSWLKIQPHEPHVRLLLDQKARGRFLIVWSKNGYAWAEAVVNALGLSSTVDMIMTKPMAYVDDSPVSEWLTERIFIPHTLEYKK